MEFPLHSQGVLLYKPYSCPKKEARTGILAPSHLLYLYDNKIYPFQAMEFSQNFRPPAWNIYIHTCQVSYQ